MNVEQLHVDVLGIVLLSVHDVAPIEVVIRLCHGLGRLEGC